IASGCIFPRGARPVNPGRAARAIVVHPGGDDPRRGGAAGHPAWHTNCRFTLPWRWITTDLEGESHGGGEGVEGVERGHDRRRGRARGRDLAASGVALRLPVVRRQAMSCRPQVALLILGLLVLPAQGDHAEQDEVEVIHPPSVPPAKDEKKP